ncbi:MAG: FtsK/SpoIIIE domain-containing protein [Planctomyces sp.]
MDDPTQAGLENQLRQLSQLLESAAVCTRRLQQVWHELSDARQHDSDTQHQLQLQYQSQRESGTAQQVAAADQRRQQTATRWELRCRQLRQATQARLSELQIQCDAECEAVEQKLQSELWVLQSVCDETQEDTPLSEAARAQENFQTQSVWLDQRLADLEQRIGVSADYLRLCHARADETLPPPVAEARNREEARQKATEQMDEALKCAVDIDRRSLPQWVLGWRVLGLAVLTFLSVAVFTTISRADISLFLNPAAGRPDWQWLGVSCGIGAAASFLISIIVVSIVQGQLRTPFGRMQQCTANAQALSEYWRQKTALEVARLQAAGERWLLDLQQRREQRVAALRAAAQWSATEARQQFQQQSQHEQSELDRLLAEVALEESREDAETDNWNERSTTELLSTLQQSFRRQQRQSEQQFQELSSQLLAEATRLTNDWNTTLQTGRAMTRMALQGGHFSSAWPTAGWSPPAQLPQSLSCGTLRARFPACPARPADAMTVPTAMPGDTDLQLPALLAFPSDTSISIRHDAAGRERALDFVRMLLLRLLTSVLPGRIQFTLIDPIGLGQSFSAMMHLADFDELLINSRIWTDATQIRDRLQKVTEHMESVFQTYLRSEFETIEDYNRAAGEVAEPYHFVVIAGFPAGFTEEACRSLSGILTSGARCGVHAIVAWSPDQLLPRNFDMELLRTGCLQFEVRGTAVVPAQLPALPAAIADRLQFTAQAAPDSATSVGVVRMVGEKSRDARRVEVSFQRIAPKGEAIWANSTAEGINLPIGRAGAARLQYLRLGRGTSQHVLIAGKTGSGKSTLMHILVTNLALHYSPAEIEFYLVDFKKGVEFRSYSACRLPHARVIAIESDREFGLSVLERLDQVLQERGELFRARGAQDVPSFRRQFPEHRMPRLLLLIDEFQEFFTSEDRVSSRASLLLDRLIRQGRAFGIHVVLGSQTLGGAYSLARSTLGQVAVRIALQCSENDAHLILSEDNSAARLLTRPGEAIYNDANGLVEGNHPFQIAWLDEDNRDELLSDLHRRPESLQSSQPPTIVFEGNVPPVMEQCRPLQTWLRTGVGATDGLPVWAGEPVAIAPPLEICFEPAAGQNVLLAGQEAEAVDAMFAATVVSAALPVAGRSSRVVLLHDGRDQVSLQNFRSAFADVAADRWQLALPQQTDDVLRELWDLLLQREADSQQRDPLVLCIRNLGQFRDLRRDEDDFGMGGFGAPKELNAAGRLSDLIRRGPAVGMHLMIWADTYANAVRWLSSSLLREFDSRIAFRMNQTDSSSLIDTPAAAMLGQGRAILYRDRTGTATPFRPFAWPTHNWLSSLVGKSQPPVTVVSEAAEIPDINELVIE